MTGALNLNVITNYLPNLEEDDVEIMKSYIIIIQNLLNHIHTNITITKEAYLKYIIIYLSLIHI